MDVHKATIAVAEGVRGREVRQPGSVANRASVVAKLAGRLAGVGREPSFGHEAGPCGHGQQRQLAGLGHTCLVAAPAPDREQGGWPGKLGGTLVLGAGASRGSALEARQSRGATTVMR